MSERHGIKCDACPRRLEPGERFYEALQTGHILCARHARETSTQWVKLLGVIGGDRERA